MYINWFIWIIFFYDCICYEKLGVMGILLFYQRNGKFPFPRQKQGNSILCTPTHFPEFLKIEYPWIMSSLKFFSLLCILSTSCFTLFCTRTVLESIFYRNYQNIINFYPFLVWSCYAPYYYYTYTRGKKCIPRTLKKFPRRNIISVGYTTKNPIKIKRLKSEARMSTNLK